MMSAAHLFLNSELGNFGKLDKVSITYKLFNYLPRQTMNMLLSYYYLL